jgi:hypothetical protein
MIKETASECRFCAIFISTQYLRNSQNACNRNRVVVIIVIITDGLWFALHHNSVRK